MIMDARLYRLLGVSPRNALRGYSRSDAFPFSLFHGCHRMLSVLGPQVGSRNGLQRCVQAPHGIRWVRDLRIDTVHNHMTSSVILERIEDAPEGEIWFKQDRKLFFMPAASRTVYGGQLLASALKASQLSLPHVPFHSYQCNFLRPVVGTQDLIYKVKPLMDGKSFSSRLITASQDDGQIVFASITSHMVPEQNMDINHTSELAVLDLPEPESLPSLQDIFEEILSKDLPDNLRQIVSATLNSPFPFDMREVRSLKSNPTGKNYLFLRCTEKLTPNNSLFMIALAYASDWYLASASMVPSGRNFTSVATEGFRVSSLDHTMHFYMDPTKVYDANKWIVFEYWSTIAQFGRGLNHANMYTWSKDESGKNVFDLVASCLQETLYRSKSTTLF